MCVPDPTHGEMKNVSSLVPADKRPCMGPVRGEPCLLGDGAMGQRQEA